MRELNILSFPLHAVSDTDFCSVGHKWHFLATGILAPAGWNGFFAPIPPNATMIDTVGKFNIPETVNWSIPMLREKWLEDLNIDLILASGIESCYMALQWHYPTIHYYNALARDEYGKLWFNYLHRWYPEVPIVFLSEESGEKSLIKAGTYQIINRGWDSNDYLDWKGDTEEVLVICTGMYQRGFYFDFISLYRKISSALPVHLIGYGNDIPELKKLLQSFSGKTYPFPLSQGKPQPQLKEDYSKYRLLFNMEPLSGRIMYEGLAAGIPVVSIQRNDELKSYIKNGVNAFMSKDVNYLIDCAKELLKNKELAREMGKEGQKIIKEHFPKSEYKRKWNDLFYKTARVK